MDQFLTYKKGNLGPVFNFTAYIYVYIYICVCVEAADALQIARAYRSEKKKWSIVDKMSLNQDCFNLGKNTIAAKMFGATTIQTSRITLRHLILWGIN